MSKWSIVKKIPSMSCGLNLHPRTHLFLQICTKRGVLGACLETQVRTLENDNDKANKYFRVQPDIVKMKDAEARLPESSEGNALIERLRRQTEENKERNALLVEQKTFENDQVSVFTAQSLVSPEGFIVT